VRERCDQVVAIPLFGHVTSLNVSVAAGIALYEAVRQRRLVPSHVRPIPPGAAPSRQRIEGPAQDDSEQDPGAPPLAARANLAEDELDELEHPIHVVREIDEDVAWGRAVEASASQEPRERARHGERPVGPPHDSRGREREPRRAEPSGGAGRPHKDTPVEAERGRGRRSRRRHGGRGPETRQAGPSRESGPPSNDAPAQGENAERPPAASGQPQAPPDAGRRRRRRWRRRGPKPPQ
jgi:hypothetical protein